MTMSHNRGSEKSQAILAGTLMCRMMPDCVPAF